MSKAAHNSTYKLKNNLSSIDSQAQLSNSESLSPLKFSKAKTRIRIYSREPQISSLKNAQMNFNFRAKPRRLASNIKQIELDLCKQLEELIVNEPISVEKLKIYQRSFDQVIASDSENASVLNHIKRAYDSFCHYKQEELRVKDKETSELQETLEEEKRNNKKLNKKFKELAQENIGFTKELAEREAHINELKTKIEVISASIPTDSENQIRKLGKKKEQLKKKLNDIKHKYKELKIEKNKYDKAIKIMKDKGFPVDEIINDSNKDVISLEVPPLVKSIPIYVEKETLKFDSDSPYINSKYLTDPWKPSDSLDFNGISPINVRSIAEF